MNKPNELPQEKVADKYLAKVKQAKDVRAVLKVDFATFASAVPEEVKVFAYEGPADKFIYYHWIRELRPSLRYEAYICKNKAKALQLFDILQSDLTGLGERVYFFVDKDFDDLQGRAATSKVFLTDRYSIENYIVCPKLLEDLLMIDFHCNGHPGARIEVREYFEKIYSKFLEITRNLNFRIFAARKLQIEQTEDLPDKINLLAQVELTEISPTEHAVEGLVKLGREPTAEEWAGLKEAFAAINPMQGYRGKFALQFFVKWLGLLRQDRASSPSVLFPMLPASTFMVDGNFSLQTLAPKAAPPKDLGAFLASI
ncbi:DUF4435 domain-containing protein [Variovorax paradoxus]|uniref:DUF4435 domain-containing protein n=1 Tax=Variovorax paradoxus TaxID=34073 RepID=UPI002784FDBE|nr:DUF4435 domain-containing protein [Variovorax paradoxus]MDQ0591366.1 hypothetical protein [Variovorax paradoxus]